MLPPRLKGVLSFTKTSVKKKQTYHLVLAPQQYTMGNSEIEIEIEISAKCCFEQNIAV